MPGPIALSSIRKQTEGAAKQANEETFLRSPSAPPASLLLPCLSSFPDFLHRWSRVWECERRLVFIPDADKHHSAAAVECFVVMGAVALAVSLGHVQCGAGSLLMIEGS